MDILVPGTDEFNGYPLAKRVTSDGHLGKMNDLKKAFDINMVSGQMETWPIMWTDIGTAADMLKVLMRALSSRNRATGN